MKEKGRMAFRSIAIDLLLIGGVFVLLAMCFGLTVSKSPALWARCLAVLDVRNWTHWTWTAVGAALLACFLLMRLWPEKKT
jgi:hypothetical protein